MDRLAGFSDDESESDYGGFDDFDDVEFNVNENSDAESGYGEAVSSGSPPLTESLYDAMSRCRLELLEELVPQIEDYATFQLTNGFKPLQYAAQLGKPELVEYFLDYNAKKGIDVNETIIPSPLVLACSITHENVDEDHLKCAQLLLEAGVDVNFKNLYGLSALMVACKSSTLDIVRLLLSQGALVNDCDNDGWSPLFFATNRGDKAIVQELLKHDVDLNKLDKRKRYAYNIAREKGFDDIAEIVKPKITAVAEQESLDKAAIGNYNGTDIETFYTDTGPTYLGDALEMLSGVATGMERYTLLFYEKKIDLRYFLLLKSDDELRHIGVMFSWHRETIISRVRQFHLGCWYPSSLGLYKAGKNNQRTNNMIQLLTVMATLHQQMFVLKVSLEYLEDDVLNFIRDDPELKDIIENMSAKLEFIVWRLNEIQKYVHNVKINDRARLLSQQVNE